MHIERYIWQVRYFTGEYLVMKILCFMVLLSLFWGCKKDTYPKFEHTFSFEERGKDIIIDKNTDHVYLKGKIDRLYSETSRQALKVIPELTTATLVQYSLPDSLIFHFKEAYGRDSLKINLFPIKIESPVSIAFTVENLVVDRDYTLYIDTTIINLIPRETPE